MTEGLKTPQHGVALLCRMLLGIAADSSPSAHPSMTFGATLKSCQHLLETAKEQAVEVVGIRYSTRSFFHRGVQPMLEGTAGSSALLEQRRGPRSHRLLCLGVRWRLGLGEVDPCWDHFGADVALREGLGGSAGSARQSRSGWCVGGAELPPVSDNPCAMSPCCSLGMGKPC